MRFEDFEVWKRSASLSVEIFKELKDLRDFAFKTQLSKTSLSIPSNIAEGYERLSHKELLQFLSYARGSSGELRTQIYIGTKINYIDRKTGQKWITEAIEISSMLTGLIKTRKKFIKNKHLS